MVFFVFFLGGAGGHTTQASRCLKAVAVSDVDHRADASAVTSVAPDAHASRWQGVRLWSSGPSCGPPLYAPFGASGRDDTRKRRPMSLVMALALNS